MTYERGYDYESTKPGLILEVKIIAKKSYLTVVSFTNACVVISLGEWGRHCLAKTSSNAQQNNKSCPLCYKEFFDKWNLKFTYKKENTSVFIAINALLRGKI